MAPSHYLNQCWNIVNWTLRNKHHWNFNRNSNIFIKENAEDLVCEMASILSQPQCVNLRLATRPLKTNGCLANRGLTSLVKEATDGQQVITWNTDNLLSSESFEISVKFELDYKMLLSRKYISNGCKISTICPRLSWVSKKICGELDLGYQGAISKTFMSS